MNIKKEITGSKTSYYANGHVYERLEVMPEEFRSLFDDHEKINGDLSNGDFKKAAKGMFGLLNKEDKTTTTQNFPSNRTLRNTERIEHSGMPLFLKIGVGLAMGAAILLTSIYFNQITNDKQQLAEEQPAQEETIPEQSVDQGIDLPNNETPEQNSAIQESQPSDKMIMLMNDPAKPTDRWFATVVLNDVPQFTFDMLHGASVAFTDDSDSLNIEMPVEKGTTLIGQTMSVVIAPGYCAVKETDEMKTVGEIKFILNKEETEFSTIYKYAFAKGNFCIAFSMDLSRTYPSESLPLKEYDEASKIKMIENWLRTIKLSEKLK